MEDSTGLLLTDLRKEERPGVMVMFVVDMMTLAGEAPAPTSNFQSVF